MGGLKLQNQKEELIFVLLIQSKIQGKELIKCEKIFNVQGALVNFTFT